MLINNRSALGRIHRGGNYNKPPPGIAAVPQGEITSLRAVQKLHKKVETLSTL